MYIYICIYTHIYIYIYVCIYMCVCVCVCVWEKCSGGEYMLAGFGGSHVSPRLDYLLRALRIPRPLPPCQSF